MALLLLCAAYVLPGFWGRTLWKAQDIEAFGYMLQLAKPDMGETLNWLKPTLLGSPDTNLALLPYWLGACMIRLAPAGFEDSFVRLPFMAMLITTLAATWYAVYALTRHPAAQPVAFAFGGEAKPADYARAVADGLATSFDEAVVMANEAWMAVIALYWRGFAQARPDEQPDIDRINALTNGHRDLDLSEVTT